MFSLKPSKVTSILSRVQQTLSSFQMYNSTPLFEIARNSSVPSFDLPLSWDACSLSSALMPDSDRSHCCAPRQLNLAFREDVTQVLLIIPDQTWSLQLSDQIELECMFVYLDDQLIMNTICPWLDKHVYLFTYRIKGLPQSLVIVDRGWLPNLSTLSEFYLILIFLSFALWMEIEAERK